MSAAACGLQAPGRLLPLSVFLILAALASAQAAIPSIAGPLTSTRRLQQQGVCAGWRGAYLYGINDDGTIQEYNSINKTDVTVLATGCVTVGGSTAQSNAFAFDKDRDVMFWLYRSNRLQDPKAGLWYWDRQAGVFGVFAPPCDVLLNFVADNPAYTNCAGRDPPAISTELPADADFYDNAFWYIPTRTPGQSFLNGYPRCSLVKVPIKYNAMQRAIGIGTPVVYDVSGGGCPAISTGLVFGDIATNRKTGIMYGSTATPPRQFFSINMKTLQPRPAVNNWNQIAAPSPAGTLGFQISWDAEYSTLYGVTAGGGSAGGLWYTLNLATGAPTLIPGFVTRPGPRDLGGAACDPLPPPIPTLTKVTDPADGNLTVGDLFTYILTIQNNGTSDMFDTVLTDTMPPGIVAKAASCTPQGSCDVSPDGASVTCQLGTVSQQGLPVICGIVAMAADVDPPGPRVNVAVLSVSNPGVADVTDNATVTVKFTYTIVVSNAGGTTLLDPTLTDKTPAGISCTAVQPDSCGIRDATVFCQLTDLEPGESFQAVIYCQGTKEGKWTNVATAESSNANTVATAAIVTVLPKPLGPVPTIVKSAWPVVMTVDDEFEYTIVASNAGDTVLRDATLKDTLPSGVKATGVSSKPSRPCRIFAGVLACNLGDMAPGDQVQITVSATATKDGVWENVATEAGNNYDGEVTDNAFILVKPPPPTPQPVVTKTADPSTVVVGQEVTYTVIVSNVGEADLLDTRLVDTVPAGITALSVEPADKCQISAGGQLVTCALGTLGPDVEVTITANATQNGVWNNVATVTAGNYVGEVEDDALVVVNPRPEKPQPVISKTVEPDTVTVGQQLTYTIEVSNVGKADLLDTTVTDKLPVGIIALAADPADACEVALGGGSVTCNLGTLTPGGSTTVSITAKAFECCGVFSNVASVTGNNYDGSVEDDASVEVVRPPPIPQPNITKSADPNTVTVGELLTFTLTVSNAGNGTMTGTTLTDDIPAGLTALSVEPADLCTLNADGSKLTCALGSLAPEASAVIVVTAKAEQAGTFKNTAVVTVTNPGIPPVSDDDTVVVKPPPPVPVPNVVKSVYPPVVAVGEQFVYTITVSNAGNATMTGTTLTDDLPNGIAGLAVEPADLCQLAPGGGSLSCALGNLAPAASVEITVTAVATRPATFYNTAVVSVTNPGIPPVEDDARVIVTSPLIGPKPNVTKSVDPETVTVGDQFTYTMVVSNAGSAAMTGTVLTDTLPAGVTGLVVEPADKCQLAPGSSSLSCALGTVQPAGSVVVTVTAVATKPGTFSNTAVVSVTNPGVPPVEDDAEIVATPPGVGPKPNLTKLADPNNVTVGKQFKYNLAVSNAGDAPLEGTTLTDTLPDGIVALSVEPATLCALAPGGTAIACQLGTLAPGDSVVVVVTAVATRVGTFKNTAAVAVTNPGIPPVTDDDTVVVTPAVCVCEPQPVEPCYATIKSCRRCAPITVYLAVTAPATLSPQQLLDLEARVHAALLAAQPQLALYPEFSVVAQPAAGGAVVAVTLPPGQVGRGAAASLAAIHASCEANPLAVPEEGICQGPIQILCGKCKPIGRPPPPGGYGGWHHHKRPPPAHHKGEGKGKHSKPGRKPNKGKPKRTQQKP